MQFLFLSVFCATSIQMVIQILHHEPVIHDSNRMLAHHKSLKISTAINETGNGNEQQQQNAVNLKCFVPDNVLHFIIIIKHE